MISEAELRRQVNFATDWERRLSYLVRDTLPVTFEMAWQTAVDVLRYIQAHQQNTVGAANDTRS